MSDLHVAQLKRTTDGKPNTGSRLSCRNFLVTGSSSIQNKAEIIEQYSRQTEGEIIEQNSRQTGIIGQSKKTSKTENNRKYRIK